MKGCGVEERVRIYSAIAQLESLGLTVNEIHRRLGISKTLVYRLRYGQGSKNLTVLPYGLTPTELLVAKEIASGKTSMGIAKKLNTSIRTTESHTTHIYRKLRINDDPLTFKRVVAAAIILKELALY